MGELEREGEVRKKRREWEVVEHCSADKLMQQSRLSQQHTPSLAQCLRGLVPVHGSPGDRLPRTKQSQPKYFLLLKLGSLPTRES